MQVRARESEKRTSEQRSPLESNEHSEDEICIGLVCSVSHRRHSSLALAAPLRAHVKRLSFVLLLLLVCRQDLRSEEAERGGDLAHHAHAGIQHQVAATGGIQGQ